MIEGFLLGNYLLLVEYTGRLFREGKAVISGELAGIFERLGSNAENWQSGLQKLAAGRLLDRFFAASRALLREVAERLGVHHLANLGGSRRDDAAPKAGFQARLHFTLPETLATVGQLYRRLSMSGSCRPSLAIRCDQRARVSPTSKRGRAGVCALTPGNWPPDMPIVQVLWNSQSQESERGHPLSLGCSKRLALPLSRPIG